jgi:hypothetical protein
MKQLVQKYIKNDEAESKLFNEAKDDVTEDTIVW